MRLREILGFICLLLAVVALGITITINFHPLYPFDIQHLNVLKDVEVDRATSIKNCDHLMMHLNSPFEKTLVFPDSLMPDSAAPHLYEMKKLSLLCHSALLVTLLPNILYLEYLAKSQRLWTLIRPFQWEMFLPVLFGFFILIDFDQFFIAFHGLFFNSDAWLFNPLIDPIINALPEVYFIHRFISFFILLEGLFLMDILIGKRPLEK